MAVYLNEREVGFDANTIGFPSIQGCMAIVAVGSGGLFGFHNFGGSGNAAWAERARQFGAFHDGHHRRGGITRLYGVTYRDQRGYSAPAQANWVGELTAFADAIRFKGKVRGVNLSASNVTSSAYVEFRKVGNKAEVWIKHWSDLDRTVGTFVDAVNQKRITPNGLDFITAANVVTDVDPTGCVRRHSTRLRG